MAPLVSEGEVVGAGPLLFQSVRGVCVVVVVKLEQLAEAGLVCRPGSLRASVGQKGVDHLGGAGSAAPPQAVQNVSCAGSVLIGCGACVPADHRTDEG
mmetsp:Transcript_948/g.2340  ORF Transcript_948/g.2340 Transcript_948/m.2340 type:complete len:98 (+) Transcript_948:362-655(+)